MPRVDDRRPRPRRGRSSRITRARVDRARRSFRARTREVRLARGLFFPPFPVFRLSLSLSRLASRRASLVVAALAGRRRDATRRDATRRSVERKPTTTNDDDDATNERTNERTRRFIFPSSVVARRVVASRVGAGGHPPNLSKRSRTVGRGGFVHSSVTTRAREREDA